MLIDCFIFFNEYDILEGRLEYLYDVVDYFVIVEMDVSFNGNPKPMNFSNNIHRYRKYADKILYFPYSPDTSKYDFTKTIEPGTNTPQWELEYAQRNYISRALALFNNSDYILISDVDEIPSKGGIELAKPHLSHGISITFEQVMFYHNFNYMHRPEWPGSVITTVEQALTTSPQQLRDDRWGMHRITGGGYHLSFWGSAENASTKLKNFSHQEYNTPEFTNIDIIKNRIMLGEDPMGRKAYHDVHMDINLIDPTIVNIFNKYSFN